MDTSLKQPKKTPLQWAVRTGKASVAYRVDQVLASSL